MTREINNTDSTIDSRDVIERIEELEDLIEDEKEEDFKEEIEELKTLKDLAEQGEVYSDWIHGAILIDEDYFTEYAEQLCKDIGEIPQELPWYIAENINWEGVADEIKVDYSCINFNGQDYWIRD